MTTKLTLSGKFVTPTWHIYDQVSNKFVGHGGLGTLAQATEFDTEDEAKTEVVYILQHPESRQLPNRMALRVLSSMQVRKSR